MVKIAIASPQETVAIDRGRRCGTWSAPSWRGSSFRLRNQPGLRRQCTIHRLNKRYLDHDEPTDVLTFPLSDPSAKKLAGELVIGCGGGPGAGQGKRP